MEGEFNLQFTSYFSNLRSVPDGYEVVSIANSCPPHFTGRSLKFLAPNWDLVNGIKNGSVTEEEFRRAYFYSLENKVKGLEELLVDIGKGKKYVFVCWEGKSKFCHRHLVSEILNKLGIPCREL